MCMTSKAVVHQSPAQFVYMWHSVVGMSTSGNLEHSAVCPKHCPVCFTMASWPIVDTVTVTVLSLLYAAEPAAEVGPEPSPQGGASVRPDIGPDCGRVVGPNFEPAIGPVPFFAVLPLDFAISKHAASCTAVMCARYIAPIKCVLDTC
jgi:hypothetical protein